MSTSSSLTGGLVLGGLFLMVFWLGFGSNFLNASLILDILTFVLRLLSHRFGLGFLYFCHVPTFYLGRFGLWSNSILVFLFSLQGF